MVELKLPHEKPRNWEEALENYKVLKEYYARRGREACLKAGRWARERGFDKKVEQFRQSLKEMIRVFEEEIFPKGESVNPFRFRVWLAIYNIKEALLFLEDALRICEEAFE